MGTTFCKKKYVRAIENFASRFFKGDVFEVIEERDGLYFVILSGEYVRSGWMKKRFEEIPNPNIINKETPMTTPLKIEVGKYYKTRGGLKAGPAERPRNTVTYSYDFVLEVNGFVKIYQSDGRNGSDNIGFSPEYDLVDIWVEPKVAVVTDFKIGDIIMNPMKPSNNRKEVLLVTEGYYFLRDLVTLSEHSVKKHMIDGVWTFAPPPPKVTKKYYGVFHDGTLTLNSHTSADVCVKHFWNHKLLGVLEMSLTDDNGKLTIESRIIPA